MVAVTSIASACTRFSYTVEAQIIKRTRGTNPEWFEIDPVSYTGEFGSMPEFVIPETVGGGRATPKGRRIGKSVPAGFEAYLQQDWVQPFLPGIFFNKAIETPNTNTFRIRATPDTFATLGSVVTDGFVGERFTTNGFVVDDTPLVVGRGFLQDANNGLHKVTAVIATKLSVAGLAAETIDRSTNSLNANASIEVCGVEVSKSSAKMTIPTVTGREVTITGSQIGTGEDYAPEPGTFVYIGGDTASTRLASAVLPTETADGTPIAGKNVGWARVERLTSAGIVCDLTTFDPIVDGSNTNDVQLFFPTRKFRDDLVCDHSRRTTYQFERRLGRGDTSDQFEQSQYLRGMTCNTLDFAMGADSLVTASFGFMGADSFQLDGTSTAEAPKSGLTTARLRPLDLTELFNTSADIKYGQIYRHDSTTSRREQLFALVTDGSISINNNLKSIKGWTVDGAYDLVPGKLVINATVTALFTKIGAVKLVEQSIDAGMFIVLARENSGFIIDIPLVTVQNAPINLAAGEEATISLTNSAAKSRFGYAMSIQAFNYLPTIACD